MKKTKRGSESKVSEMLSEYNFDYSKSKPNRFAKTEKQIVVQIDEDVAKVFSSSEEVNTALRTLILIYPKGKSKTPS
ncbi:MAG: hypothetical protein M1495_07195 [Bacteroidetes bacterium]|nr:hypothetical protein [Bacteroidota bacterium]MCL6100828.1 hypothetical protein [Bacteroidota bacterium]